MIFAKKFRLFIVALGLTAVLVSGCGKNAEDTEEEVPKKQIVAQTIAKQDVITTNLSVSGTVVPQQFAVIRALTPGTIEYLAPIGSAILVGQSLFNIRDANIENSYFNSLQNFDQISLVADQSVQQSDLNALNAKTNFEFAERGFVIAEKQAQQNTSAAQRSAIVAYNTAYNVLSQTLLSLNRGSITKTASGNLMVQYVYSDTLTPQTQLQADAETQLGIAIASFNKLPATITEDELDAGLILMHGALLDAKQLIDLTSILLQNAIIGGNLTSATLESNKAVNTTLQTQVNGSTQGLISAQNTLANTVINNELLIDQAQSRLDTAQIQYDNALVALESAANSSVLQKTSAKSQFDSAAYNFTNLSLASPFSGTVLSHSLNFGQQVTPGQEILELGNLSIVEIAIDVDSSFAEGLALGDEVTIDESIPGFIAEIEPAADVISGKITIVVQADNEEIELVSGSIVDVSLQIIYEEPGSIVIPIRAATIEETGSTVLLVVDGTVAERKVNLGQLFGDKVSVSGGLEEGDQVIIPNGIFVSVGDEVEIQ